MSGDRPPTEFQEDRCSWILDNASELMSAVQVICLHFLLINTNYKIVWARISFKSSRVDGWLSSGQQHCLYLDSNLIHNIQYSAFPH